MLETVRLLSDFETPRAKLMHIILAGQPELADKPLAPVWPQLRQRVSIVNGLNRCPPGKSRITSSTACALPATRVSRCLPPRLTRKLRDSPRAFPGTLITFCFNALSLACALRKKMVDDDVVREVMADLDISETHFPRRNQ